MPERASWSHGNGELATKLLVAVALCVAGCGGHIQSTATISWTGNGNPAVPVCGAVKANCVSSVTVRDAVTGAVVVAAPAPGSVAMQGAADSFEIETNGYDSNGAALSSGYEPVSAAK